MRFSFNATCCIFCYSPSTGKYDAGEQSAVVFQRASDAVHHRPHGRAAHIEIARGLANYGSAEARLIARKPSSEFERLLGYSAEPEMIHRDNLVLA